jgi:hypothetical protein
MPERTTIVLPPALKKKAMARARTEGISFGEFVRQSLRDKLTRPQGKRKGKDPFWSDVAVYDGPVPADVSVNHDKYLYDEE